MAGYSRILVAIDFSESTDTVLEAAATLARTLGASLDVLHVCALHGEGRAEAQAELTKLLARVPGLPAGERLVVKALSPELGIVHAARERHADLVVLGTHGRSGLKHVLVGSVAERVVQLCDSPVLTVRRPGHDFQRP